MPFQALAAGGGRHQNPSVLSVGLPGADQSPSEPIGVQPLFWETADAGPVLMFARTKPSAGDSNANVLLMLFLPDDHSRVILTQVDGVPPSDYINASYIDVSSVFHAKQQGSPQYRVLIITGAAVMTLEKLFSKLSVLFWFNRV